MRQREKKAGFTLIETVIYIALFSLVVGVFVSFVLTISGLRSKQRSAHDVLSNERVLDGLLRYYVNTADEIVSPGPIATSSSMIFRKSGSSTTSRIYVSEGMIYLEEDGNSVPMLSSDCEVRDVVFSNLSSDNLSSSINVVGFIETRFSASADNYFGTDFNFNSRTRR